MRVRRFFWKLFLGNAILLTLAILTSAALILKAFDDFYRNDVVIQLQAQAAALREEVDNALDIEHAAQLDTIAKRFGSGGWEGSRITFIAANGTVLGDSEADPARMESHADRPEIMAALADEWGRSTRWSRTVSRDLQYVALRVGSADHPRGVIRVSMALRTIGMRGDVVRRLSWSIAITVVGAAILLAMGLAKLWSSRLARLTEVARTMSRGDLSTRVAVTGWDETAVIARALNRIRARLSAQLETIDHQRRTVESLVAQLGEGVIVTDSAGCMLLVNPAAQRLLPALAHGAPGATDAYVGQPLERYVVQPVLQGLLRRTLPDSPISNPELAEQDSAGAQVAPGISQSRLEMEGPIGSVSVLARASDIVLPPSGSDAKDDSRDPEIGRLLVLTDVTELSHAIQVKTDFASNASHELRTPLSAIRAAVETLRSLEAFDASEQARNFVDVIDRQSERMQAMVADLLDLSRIESHKTSLAPSRLQTQAVLEQSKARYADTAAGKQVAVTIEIGVGAEWVIANEQLLHTALGNLVENAIRFTGESGRERGQVRLTSRVVDGCIEISVIDNGCGIPPEDRDRVFERFYQVQRARSGPDRGTGLGLSIVKHAVAAMNGTVTLTSELGKGTECTIRLAQGDTVA